MIRAIPLVLALLTVSLTACRKVPQAAPPTAAPKATPVAEVQNAAAPVVGAESPAVPEIDRSAQVTVLGYHRFVDKVRHPDTEITPGDFEAQMKALKDAGIAVISMADFLAWRHEEKDIPPRSALLTIDDGYNVAYSIAWPILKKFGYPFTLFIYTDYIRGGPKSGGGSLSWEQLAEMRDAGVGIGSHSVSHRDLRGGKNKAGDPAYEQWLWNELNGSKAKIEGELGIKVTALALPYGSSNPHVREMAAKAGYEMIFTVNGEKIRFTTPMDALGRYVIPANQPKVFTAAVSFDGHAGGTSVAAMPAKSIQPLPEDKASISERRPLIRASLAGVGPVEPESVKLRISGLGEVPARFDPQTGIVTYQVVQKLLPNPYTVILAARAQGKKYEYRWNFTVQPDDDGADAARQ